MGVADFPIEILKALRVKSSTTHSVNSNTPKVSESQVPLAHSSLSHSQSSDFTLAHHRESFVSSSTADSDAIQTASPLPSAQTEFFEASGAQSTREPSMLPHLLKQHSEPSGSQFSQRTSTSEALGDSESKYSSQEQPDLQSAAHHPYRSLSGSQTGQISLDAALGAGKGIGRIVGAGVKSPMDFTLSLARGFHNAPKLYGDDSVRQPDKITGFQSGLKAAGKVSASLQTIKDEYANR